MQGTRAYRPAPAAMPAVGRFGRRITALLDTPLTTDARGGLTPTVLGLSPAAHAAWVRLHDLVERGQVQADLELPADVGLERRLQERADFVGGQRTLARLRLVDVAHRPRTLTASRSCPSSRRAPP
ncbi:MAG TPA: hypothetical protein P5163_20440, partial [Rubrivivax sp.]|nr:hypothetical protein [Rubrivivax sp.]HRY89639.1 hypothetical protein [Rubrivivax sp.]HRZ62957.1 hypothetical protein [Rubrivivax sp.]